MSEQVRAPFGAFPTVHRAIDIRGGLAAPVAAALESWAEPEPEAAASVLHVDTDPERADTAVFCAAYGVPPELSANCVVVAAKRGGETTLAGCLVLATTRLDVNQAVRRHLGARKASFAPMDMAVEATGMEYGGITPVGLPDGWPLLVDAAVAAAPNVLIGSGSRRGKLILPGWALARLPGAEIIEGLATAPTTAPAAVPPAVGAG